MSKYATYILLLFLLVVSVSGVTTSTPLNDYTYLYQNNQYSSDVYTWDGSWNPTGDKNVIQCTPRGIVLVYSEWNNDTQEWNYNVTFQVYINTTNTTLPNQYGCTGGTLSGTCPTDTTFNNTPSYVNITIPVVWNDYDGVEYLNTVYGNTSALVTLLPQYYVKSGSANSTYDNVIRPQDFYWSVCTQGVVPQGGLNAYVVHVHANSTNILSMIIAIIIVLIIVGLMYGLSALQDKTILLWIVSIGLVAILLLLIILYLLPMGLI